MKRFVLVLAIVALAAPLAAQEKTEVFAFFDDPSLLVSSDDGTHASSGYGASLRYFVTPRFSTELSVARRHRDVFAYDASNSVLLTEYRAKVTPIDLVSSYHFTTDSRWKPYLGAGLHYLSVTGVPGVRSRLGLQLAGGVAFNVTPHVFLRMDGKVLAKHKALPFEDQTRGSFGLGWRF